MNEEIEETTEEETKYYPVYRQVADDCAQRIKDGRRIVEGTAFAGFNRRQRRARWERNQSRGVRWDKKARRWVKTDAPAGYKWAGNATPVKHEIVRQREAAAIEAANADVERPLTYDAPTMPMHPERRWEIYGDDPTPKQARRIKKKFRRSVKLMQAA